MQRFLTGFLVLLIACGLVAVACGGGDDDTTIDTGDGEVSISDDIPDDFPDELRYDGADVVGTISGESEGQEGTYVTFETDDSVDDVSAYYESALEDNGWQDQSNTSAGGVSIIGAQKDDTAVVVSIGEGDGNTTISVFYGTNPSASGDGSSDGEDDGSSGEDDGSSGEDDGSSGEDDGSSGEDDGSSGESDLPDEVEVDEAYPSSDIPLPADARVTGSSSFSTSGIQTVQVTGLSQDSPSELGDYFAGELEGAGYSEVVRTTSDGDVFMTYAKSPDDPSVDAVTISLADSTTYEGYTEFIVGVTQAERD